jgi:hypothetical protein
MVSLDRESLEPTLPQAPGRFVLRVVPSHMCGERPVHPLCEIGRGSRPHDKMNMIWHQTGGENRQLKTILRTADERLKLLVVVRRMKDTCLLVATIQHVIAVVSNNCPSRPWHVAKVAQPSIEALLRMRRDSPDSRTAKTPHD